jgi:hypothetical protein
MSVHPAVWVTPRPRSGNKAPSAGAGAWGDSNTCRLLGRTDLPPLFPSLPYIKETIREARKVRVIRKYEAILFIKKGNFRKKNSLQNFYLCISISYIFYSSILCTVMIV